MTAHGAWTQTLGTVWFLLRTVWFLLRYSKAITKRMVEAQQLNRTLRILRQLNVHLLRDIGVDPIEIGKPSQQARQYLARILGAPQGRQDSEPRTAVANVLNVTTLSQPHPARTIMKNPELTQRNGAAVDKALIEAFKNDFRGKQANALWGGSVSQCSQRSARWYLAYGLSLRNLNEMIS
jgi:uncharacterized protein YjiS (DUF1127 family)